MGFLLLYTILTNTSQHTAVGDDSTRAASHPTYLSRRWRNRVPLVQSTPRKYCTGRVRRRSIWIFTVAQHWVGAVCALNGWKPRIGDVKIMRNVRADIKTGLCSHQQNRTLCWMDISHQQKQSHYWLVVKSTRRGHDSGHTFPGSTRRHIGSTHNQNIPNDQASTIPTKSIAAPYFPCLSRNNQIVAEILNITNVPAIAASAFAFTDFPTNGSSTIALKFGPTKSAEHIISTNTGWI